MNRGGNAETGNFLPINDELPAALHTTECIGASALSAGPTEQEPVQNGVLYPAAQLRAALGPDGHIPVRWFDVGAIVENPEQQEAFKWLMPTVRELLDVMFMYAKGQAFTFTQFINKVSKQKRSEKNEALTDVEQAYILDLLTHHPRVQIEISDTLPTGDARVDYVPDKDLSRRILQSRIRHFSDGPVTCLSLERLRKWFPIAEHNITPQQLARALRKSPSVTMIHEDITVLDCVVIGGEEAEREELARTLSLVYDAACDLAKERDFRPSLQSIVRQRAQEYCDNLGLPCPSRHFMDTYIASHAKLKTFKGTERAKPRVVVLRSSRERGEDQDLALSAIPSHLRSLLTDKNKAFRAHALEIQNALNVVIEEFKNRELYGPSLSYLRNEVTKLVDIPEAFEEVFALNIARYQQEGSEFLRLDAPDTTRLKGVTVDLNDLKTYHPRVRVSDINVSPRFGGAGSLIRKQSEPGL